MRPGQAVPHLFFLTGVLSSRHRPEALTRGGPGRGRKKQGRPGNPCHTPVGRQPGAYWVRQSRLWPPRFDYKVFNTHTEKGTSECEDAGCIKSK